MGDKTVSTYYIKNLPKTEERKPSLSDLKLKKMNYERFNATNIPKNIDELKQLRRRELAVEFMTRYAAGGIKSKNAYIKEKHISINTLNKALFEAGNTVKPRKQTVLCEGEDVKSTATLLKNVLKLNSNRRKENRGSPKRHETSEDSFQEIPA